MKYNGKMVMQPRIIDQISTQVTLKAAQLSHSDWPSIFHLRRWYCEYVIENHESLTREIGPVLADVTPEFLQAYLSRTYKRSSNTPPLEKGSSPAEIRVAVTPAWIAIKLCDFSYLEIPMNVLGIALDPFWTFLLKEKGQWVEYWRDDIAITPKGSLLLPGNLYFPSDRSPWPLPIKDSGVPAEIGKLNYALIPQKPSSVLQRIYRKLPGTRARKELEFATKTRDILAPKYTRTGT